VKLHRLWHRMFGHPWRFVPGSDANGSIRPACILCDTCEVARMIVLPSGHPESLTADLPNEHESILAALEAEAWPETADIDHCRDVLKRIFPLDFLRPGEAG